MGCIFSAPRKTEVRDAIASSSPSSGSSVPTQGTTQKMDAGTEEYHIDEALRQKVLVQVDQEIDKRLREKSKKHDEKALFIGTGESGKSTVFKQMKLCYDDGFGNYERQMYSKLIWADTIRAIRLLVDICDAERHNPDAPDKVKQWIHSWFGDPSDKRSNDMNIHIIQSLDLTRRALVRFERSLKDRNFLYNHVTMESPDAKLLSQSEDHEHRQEMLTVITKALKSQQIVHKSYESTMRSRCEQPLDIPVNREVLGDVAAELWDSCPKEIRSLVENNQLGMDTNAAYFLNRIPEVRDIGYTASDSDILRARIKTIGIAEAEFQVRKSRLVVLDVGGQRIERGKWIHDFDDISCLLFVASVSEYDEVLEEDHSVNRLTEALEVFRQTVNSRWFKSKSVQLFLNKTDILEHKCAHSSFKARFEDYTGDDNDPKEIIAYIEEQFRARFVANDRNLYVHHTCATDTTAMKFVLTAASDMILFENMKWAGML